MIHLEHLTTDEQIDALDWHKITDGLAKPMVLDARCVARIWHVSTGKWRIADEGGLWSEKDGEHPSLEAAVLAAYNAHKQAARRELAAKKLADLELKEESEGCAVSIHSGAVRISDAWGPTFEPTGKWTVSDRVADVPGSFSDFHQAVDSAHAAKFGRTAELNEPITHVEPDGDTCQTSELDLLRAENDRLRAALAEAGALANKRGEEIVKLNAAANRQHAADKWESQAVRLEWSPWEADKETDLRATFGGFSAYIARITLGSQVTAKLYYTDTTNGETVTITGLDLAKIAPILSTLVEAAGFTMPPIPVLPVQE